MESKTKTLLVLDTDDLDRDSAARTAKCLDFKFVYVTAVDKALKEMAEKKIFALLYNFASTLKVEPDFTKILKRDYSKTAYLPVLQSSHRHEAVNLLQEGAWACLESPINADALSYHLTKLIAERSNIYNPFSVRYEERTIVLPNDFSLVVQVVKSLVYSTLPIEEKKKYQIILGLNEIVNNAIEHGNLGISFEEKSAALQKSRFFKLAFERAAEEPYKHRVVTLKVKVVPPEHRVEYTVIDEGNGFDWKKLPDPKNRLNVLSRSGRGIMIAKFAFDQIIFNKKGNQVTLIYHTKKK